MCIYQYLTMEVYSSMSFIYLLNKYLQSIYFVFWGFSSKDKSDLCPDGPFRPLWVRQTLWVRRCSLWVLQKKPRMFCWIISQISFWECLKDTFPLICKGLLDPGTVPDYRTKEKISIYQFNKYRLPRLQRLLVAAFNCGSHQSFLWIRHT